MRFLGIDSTCRASFYFYNTKEDVDMLIKGLDKAYNMFKKYMDNSKEKEICYKLLIKLKKGQKNSCFFDFFYI